MNDLPAANFPHCFSALACVGRRESSFLTKQTTRSCRDGGITMSYTVRSIRAPGSHTWSAGRRCALSRMGY